MRERTRIDTVYMFDELDEHAKERARDWYRSVSTEYDTESVLEDCVTVAAMLGVKVYGRTVTLGNGSTRTEPIIYWDTNPIAAGFSGHYAYKPGAVKAIKAYAPMDTELHAIAKQLQDWQRKTFYRVTASITADRRGLGITVETERTDDRWIDDDRDRPIVDALEDLNHWFACAFNREIEYQNSAEHIDETIAINEYEFTENGERA